MKVFVVDMNEEPLMPCGPRKARLLLKDGSAVVFRHRPFTIKMARPTGHNKQSITLGVDPGYKHIGLSASTEKEELYASEIELREDITEKLATRRAWRRARRNQLEYRKPRFDNRRRKEGWLSPATRSRLDAHFHHIRRLAEIMPISKIRLEVAAFDIQKIKNSDVQGSEYQQGEQLGFWNVREYVLLRDGHQCQHCKGKSKNPVLEVHHLESRKTGGDAPNNLITLCETCHKAFHAGKIELKQKRGVSFKPETFMGILRLKLSDMLRTLNIPVDWTYGYLTKYARISHNIQKTHIADAFCIAGNMSAKRLGYHIFFKQVRKRGRQVNKANLAKGDKWLAKKTAWEVKGFHRYDKVLFGNVIAFIWSLRKRGDFILKTLAGEKAGETSFKKVKLLERASSWLSEVRMEPAIPLRHECRSPHAEEM